MNEDKLRDFCLALPQSFESFPFGEETSVFKTSGNGKIFALGRLDTHPLTVTLKCDPEESLALRAEFAGIIPGYHLNKKHWITINTTRVPAELVEQLLTDSHRLVRPRPPRAPKAKSPEAKSPKAKSPEAKSPEAKSPEAKSPKEK
jgi:predicted DNA-binding protein (MmcQ/YjbR family)